jgi:hypothetical protein
MSVAAIPSGMIAANAAAGTAGAAETAAGAETVIGAAPTAMIAAEAEAEAAVETVAANAPAYRLSPWMRRTLPTAHQAHLGCPNRCLKIYRIPRLRRTKKTGWLS